MYYTGIDLHRKTSFLTTVDSKGQIIKKDNLKNDEARILEYFLSLDDDTQVFIESTATWHWLYDLLTCKSHKTYQTVSPLAWGSVRRPPSLGVNKSSACAMAVSRKGP
jgi:hypothetical protein